MRRVIQTLAALALLGAIAGAAIVGLGLYNVSARTGHLGIVAWALHTTYRQSVKLRAMSETEVPDALDDPALIELGARHYMAACAVCHSVPGEDQTATVEAMEPIPPPIELAVAPWEANHLHWIVWNGVKMSGMPAWPAQEREDEAWAVVAYLLAIKRGLSAEAQAVLTATPASEGPPGAGYCTGCHGGVDTHVPRLDIQTADYLAAQLSDYRSGVRESGIMAHAATEPGPEALEELAQWFGAQEPAPSDARAPSSELTTEGEALARAGTDDVPACTACHGPGATERNDDFPSLSGQDEAFLRTDLRLWRDGVRQGSPLMEKAAMDLTDADIDVLAAWYASLPPAKPEN